MGNEAVPERAEYKGNFLPRKVPHTNPRFLGL
jgi:hypothetical protein